MSCSNTGKLFFDKQEGHFSYHNLKRNFLQVSVTLVSRNTKQTSGLAKALYSEMYRKHAWMTNHATAPQKAAQCMLGERLGCELTPKYHA